MTTDADQSGAGKVLYAVLKKAVAINPGTGTSDTDPSEAGMVLSDNLETAAAIRDTMPLANKELALNIAAVSELST